MASIDLVTARVATNMVFVDEPSEHREALRSHARSASLVLGGFRTEGLRVVCHLDIDAAAVERLIDAFASCFAAD
ncbi:MAG: hypothetical protein GY910_28075 [bacterium]|nr:hypothetical protein [bacterium]